MANEDLDPQKAEAERRRLVAKVQAELRMRSQRARKKRKGILVPVGVKVVKLPFPIKQVRWVARH